MTPTPPADLSLPQTGLLRQIATIARALHRSPVGKALMWLALAIVIVVGATAFGQIRLNVWNKD